MVAVLGLSKALAEETAAVWDKVKDHTTPMEWPAQAALISQINALKKERNAVILAHNYMTPDIFHGVGDFVGDSLALAKEAANCTADVIVQAGVHFMAETSKILSPEKTVLIPDLRAGCSLASSITGADVRLIKQRYPGLPVITYVNTTADVKAETDICCTSANAVQVVEWAAKQWGVEKVILIPDEYLARNVAAQTDVGIIAWAGHCEVHKRFTAQDIADMRAAWPGAEVLAHPECPEEILQAADYAGSTAAMISYVEQKRPAKVVLITECSMASNIKGDVPEVDFVGPCNMCPHMKRITLENIRDCLLHMQFEVTVEPQMQDKARAAVQRMIDLPPPEKPARYDLLKAKHSVAVELI